MASQVSTEAHPVLLDLKLQRSPQDDDEVSCFEILSHLLATGAVSETVVRETHQLVLAKNTDAAIASPSTIASTTPKNETVQSKPVVPQFRTRHIALHLYYDGHKYNGLSENVGSSDDQSVEKALFAALTKTRFVESRQTCAYSRCGRTDRGVSAAGQVVALQLKSAFTADTTWDAEGRVPVETKQLPNNALDAITVWTLPRKRKQHAARQEKQMSEYAYDKILNNILPDDIRILGWTPVSEDFSARFSATTRTYHYFFVPGDSMDTQLIQRGLDAMVGTHDFRNFCKMDVEKVYNFRRTIHSATVEQQEGSPIYYLRIVGQAFLWHQIRCMASVLFLIGRGLEEPTIVTELLDVQKHPRKPAYAMAPERPLVLHECGYKDLHFGYSAQNMYLMYCHFQGQWEELSLAAARIRNSMEVLREQKVLQEDAVRFCHNKLSDRAKKKGRRKASTSGSLQGLPAPPSTFENLVYWGDVLDWMKESCIIPEASDMGEMVHIPLLERSKGTSYEEKLEAVQKSAKRKNRYESNVIQKRQTKEVDRAFYAHMTNQGGSAFSSNNVSSR